MHSEKFISRVIACMSAVVRPRGSGKTASWLPSNGRSVKTSRWRYRIAVMMIDAGVAAIELLRDTFEQVHRLKRFHEAMPDRRARFERGVHVAGHEERA